MADCDSLTDDWWLFQRSFIIIIMNRYDCVKFGILAYYIYSVQENIHKDEEVTRTNARTHPHTHGCAHKQQQKLLVMLSCRKQFLTKKKGASLQLQKVHSGATLEMRHEYAGADVKLSLKRARLLLQICVCSCKPVLSVQNQNNYCYTTANHTISSC